MCPIANGDRTQVKKQGEITRGGDETTVYDVVVVGSGWSGLAAGRKLLAGGVTKFKILEARDYIGGRSVTSYQLGKDTPVELGSEWIHGRRKNPIQALVEDIGIPHAPITASKVAIGTSGRVYSEGELDKARKLRNDLLSYVARRQFRDECDTDLRSIVKAFSKKKRLRASGIDGRAGLELVLRDEIVLDYACELEHLSLMWWDDDHDFKGGDTYLAIPNGGHSALISKFASPLAPHVQLQSKVTKIDYHDDITTVTYDDIMSGVEWKVVKARHVIVTLPLGVLKAGSVIFDPALSPAKQAAIDGLGTALLNKCAMYWDGMKDDDIFWPKDKEWIMKFHEKPVTEPKWTEFYNAYEMNGGKTILVANITANAARTMEHQTDDEVREEVVQSLREMFGSERVPYPTDVIVTRWGRDEFALGSYSYLPLGSTPNDRKELGKTVSNKLWFAGEATNMNHPSTTHGAMTSGELAATRIVAHMMKKKCGGATTTYSRSDTS